MEIIETQPTKAAGIERKSNDAFLEFIDNQGHERTEHIFLQTFQQLLVFPSPFHFHSKIEIIYFIYSLYKKLQKII